MNSYESLISDAKNAMDAHDGEALAAVFVADGRVTDESKEHVGRAAIARWFESTPPIRLETLDAAIVGNVYTLIAKGHGDYPNSPLTFRYVFVLGDAGIRSLSISLADEDA